MIGSADRAEAIGSADLVRSAASEGGLGPAAGGCEAAGPRRARRDLPRHWYEGVDAKKATSADLSFLAVLEKTIQHSPKGHPPPARRQILVMETKILDNAIHF